MQQPTLESNLEGSVNCEEDFMKLVGECNETICELGSQEVENLRRIGQQLLFEVIKVGGDKQGKSNVLIRKANNQKHLKIAVCGNVDAGKSTLVGVLRSGNLDNGRGHARSTVFNFSHERETGRTSSVAKEVIGFDIRGESVNYTSKKAKDMDSFFQKSTKLISFVDLAGHEKYLAMTVAAMTGTLPDYCLILVGANMGITQMTKEHLGLALSLKLPIIIVITKCDISPPEIRKKTLHDVAQLLKMKTVCKMPKRIQTEEQLVSLMKMNNERITPIFEVSSVTGEGLDVLKKYLNVLPPRIQWETLVDQPAELTIDQTYLVSGVGTVVCGTMLAGTVEEGQAMLLGPFGKGEFKEVTVKSIQSHRVSIKKAYPGQNVGFSIKKVNKNEIRAGMVLLSPMGPKTQTKSEVTIRATWAFYAEVHVLSHSTTLKEGYQPIIQCLNIKQAAKITQLENKKETNSSVVRTGESARVTFQFMFRPEYLKVGMRFIMREGHCKGIGIITGLSTVTI